MVVSRLTKWLVKHYPDAVLVALKPDAKNWKAGCEFMVDIDGHKYYKFRDSGDVPLGPLQRNSGCLNSVR